MGTLKMGDGEVDGAKWVRDVCCVASGAGFMPVEQPLIKRSHPRNCIKGGQWRNNIEVWSC